MTLLLSDEQREFQSTVRAFFAERFPSEILRRRIEGDAVSDPAQWQDLMELGLSVSFGAERDGGFGLGVHDLSIVSFETGYALVPEPILEHALFGSFLLSSELARPDGLIKHFGADALNEIVAGSRRVGVIPSISANQEISINGEHASGHFGFAPAIEGSSYILFVAKRGSERVVCASKTDGGISLERQSVLDQSVKRFSGQLHKLPVVILPIQAELVEQLEQAVLAIQLAGCAARAVEMTVDYVKQRKQFDLPIGGFQAVQHRLADMYLACEAMRALSNFAAWSAQHSRDQLPLAASSAMRFAAEKAAFVLEGAIQLHGGIGFTWEYDLHLYLRRVKTLQALYGGVVKPANSRASEVANPANSLIPR